MARETRRIGPARGGKYKTLPRRLTYTATAQAPRYCMDVVDFEQVLADMSDEEEAGLAATSSPASRGDNEGQAASIADAVHLSLSARFEEARDVAEAVQQADPTDSVAICINGAECESRQDWSEAARFFLVGMGQNCQDGALEHGFQTNVDMLRTQRHKMADRALASKWDDVLTFKPRAPRLRPPSPEEKDPWWRLGPWYEELLEDPGHLVDHLSQSGDADENIMEVRRILYQNLDFLDKLYAYYRDDMNENIAPEATISSVVKHDGHEDMGSEQLLKLAGWWRLLKECKIAYGDVKQKLPVAVFDRLVVNGKLFNSKQMQANANYEIAEVDPHLPDLTIDFYEFVETLVRLSYIKIPGHSPSESFELLINDYLKPFAMHKQTDKAFLDWRSGAVQGYFHEELTRWRLHRIFQHFILTYKQNRLKSTALGPNDVTMSFNHAFTIMEKCDLFDPQFTVKKLVECYCKVTLDSDLLPQEHPNNQNSEMVFEEFLDFLIRCARVKSNNSKLATVSVLTVFVEEMMLKAGRLIPGKF